MPEILPLLSGMVTLGLITGNQRFSPGFALALGYGLGMGILGQLMLFLGWREVPLNIHTVSYALFIYISTVFLLFLLRLKFFPSQSINFSKDRQAWTWVQRSFFAVMLSYVLYQLCFIFWNTFYCPIDQADAYSGHAYRAEQFFYSQHLNLPTEGHYLTYPLQVHLSMAWVAMNIGRWHEGWVQMIFPLYCVAFITIVYNFMKYWTDKLTALLTVSLLLSSLFFVLHAAIAYCDFTEMFYAMASFLLIAWGIKERHPAFILLGGLMAAFATQVKFQGIEYWVFGMIILCRYLWATERSNLSFVLKSIAGFILPLMAVETNYSLYKSHYHVSEIFNQPYLAVHLKGTWQHIFTLLLVLFDNFFLSGNWNILWFFLIVAVSANAGRKKPFMVRSLGLVLFLCLAVYMIYGVFPKMFNYMDTGLDNVSRFLLHFFPLCPILTGLLIYNFLNDRSDEIASH